MDTLELRWRNVGGKGASGFWDIVVSGKSLYDHFGSDNVPLLGTVNSQAESNAVDRMLLLAPGDYESGRVALLVCPLCADLDCGAVSVHIEQSDNIVTWSDFRLTPNTDEAHEELVDLGSYRFEVDRYRSAILNRAR